MENVRRDRIRARILRELKRCGEPPPAAVVRLERIRLGLTQAEIAELVGLTLNGWQKYEQGERGIPLPTWRLFSYIARRIGASN